MSAAQRLADIQARFNAIDTAPRPPAQLPRDDGLGLGLHATSRPRWRPNWPVIYGWAIGLVSCCVWALAVVGVVRLVRP